jgi:hypothetical protein
MTDVIIISINDWYIKNNEGMKEEILMMNDILQESCRNKILMIDILHRIMRGIKSMKNNELRCNNKSKYSK